MKGDLGSGGNELQEREIRLETMKVIVLGTHEWFWALRSFADIFNLHWGRIPVDHYGDVECENLPQNFRSMRVPAYTEGSWPWDNWFGNGLLSILEKITDRHVLIFLPDHWITQQINGFGINKALVYMKDNQDVVRCELTVGSCLEQHHEEVAWFGSRTIVQVPPSHAHCSLCGGITFSPAMWNRRALLELLEPHWDLWDCEKVGTEKMARLWPKWRSVGILPAPIKRAHGLSHHQPRVAFVGGLNSTDRRIVRGNLPDGWRLDVDS